MKSVLLSFLAILILVVLGVGFWLFGSKGEQIKVAIEQKRKNIFEGVGYVGSPDHFEVHQVAQGLENPVRVRMALGSGKLLVAQQDGTILEVNPTTGVPRVVKRFDTNNFSDLVFSVRFPDTGKVFGIYDNKIAVSVLTETDGVIRLSEPQVIYEGDEVISTGFSAEVAGKPKLLLIDSKIRQISEEGVHEVVIVEEYGGGRSIVRNFLENEGRFIYVDGAAINMAKLLDVGGRKIVPVIEKLDEMVAGASVSELAFYTQGRGVIPRAVARKTNLFVALPHGEIRWGKLEANLKDPRVVWETVVTRNPEAVGKVAYLSGMVVDDTTGDIFFADREEGKIYLLKVLE